MKKQVFSIPKIKNFGKRGQEIIGPYTYLIGVILVVVVFIGLIFFQAEVMDFLRSLGDEAPCRTSVYLNAYTKVSGKEFVQNAKLDCPTRHEEVSKESEVLPTVANEAYKCWDDFGSGKLELFDHDSWSEKKTFCHVCSTIEFGGRLEGNLPGFLEYVGTQGVGDKTYLELLYGVKFTEDNMEEYKNSIIDVDKNSINLDNSLGIVFVYGKESFVDKKYSALLGGLGGGGVALIALGPTFIPYFSLTAASAILAGAEVGATTGYAFGHTSSADWDAKVLVVPYTKEGLSKLNCERLPIKTE